MADGWVDAGAIVRPTLNVVVPPLPSLTVTVNVSVSTAGVVNAPHRASTFGTYRNVPFGSRLTTPLLGPVVTTYVRVSPSASLATTVPVISPIAVFGLPTTAWPFVGAVLP